MAEFVDDFMNNGAVDDAPLGNSKRTIFTIQDVTVENTEPFSGAEKQQCIVFHIIDKDGVKTDLKAPLNKKDGTPRKTMFWDMSWDKNNEKPVQASLFTDLKDAIKAYMGEEKYEERKKTAGGLNKKFYKNAKFEAELASGKSKEDKEYYIVKLPSYAKINSWESMIQRGDFIEFKQIPEVQQMFPKDISIEVVDNSSAVERIMGNATDQDDLPF